ncbi:MAG: anti-sigma factor antagonist [Mycobacterium sp.]|nr:anti-sigma factor antagonist [Mycobacterium sp.]
MTDTEPITTSVVQHKGITVLAVGGEVDLATAPIFEKAIDDALAGDPPALVIDLTQVSFLASAGLQLLVATQERIGGTGEFAVVADGPATSRPIQLTELDKIFGLYPVLEDALSAMQTRAR